MKDARVADQKSLLLLLLIFHILTNTFTDAGQRSMKSDLGLLFRQTKVSYN